MPTLDCCKAIGVSMERRISVVPCTPPSKSAPPDSVSHDEYHRKCARRSVHHCVTVWTRFPDIFALSQVAPVFLQARCHFWYAGNNVKALKAEYYRQLRVCFEMLASVCCITFVLRMRNLFFSITEHHRLANGSNLMMELLAIHANTHLCHLSNHMPCQRTSLLLCWHISPHLYCITNKIQWHSGYKQS